MPAVPGSAIDWQARRERILDIPRARPAPPWVKLPSPPLALMRCMERAQDPDVAAADLAPILEKDAGLTCQILRHVNSAAQGLAQPVNTVSEALARLGIRYTVMYLTAEVMKQTMKSSAAKLLNINSFSATNLERGLLARRLANHIGADGELAFCAALIADCLLPVVTNQAFRTYLRMAEGQSTMPIRIVEFEQKEFGWTHPWMTASIFHAWGFPDDLTCCIALHHSRLELLEDSQLSRSAAAAVAIAGLIPDQIQQEPEGLAALRTLPARLPGLDLMQTARELEAEYREVSPELEHPFPLVRHLSKRR